MAKTDMADVSDTNEGGDAPLIDLNDPTFPFKTVWLEGEMCR